MLSLRYLARMRHCVVLRRLPVVAMLLVVASLGLTAFAPAAATPARRPAFRPRIGFAMGILPRRGATDAASGTNPLVVYHGGEVMRAVTVHTVFWAPPGYRFDGSPSPGVLGYEDLMKQFLTDVARAGGASGDVFSTLTQYHDANGPGDTRLSYDPAVDSIDWSAPYPARSQGCASPSGTATCLTDDQLQRSLDGLIAERTPRDRGLHNLWLIFLPPDVDTCLLPGTCATNSYAGYHSEFDRGHGPTVYVPVPDPLLEFTPSPGSDPQGNPEAESSLDTVAHEVVESVTDPYGTGWMDPNGLEVGDECELGPQEGTPLGYAPDGSPYNQVINGHQYLLQDMWSNAAAGCVQGSAAPGPPADLPTVSLRQFSPSLSGSLGHPGRRIVRLKLLRAGRSVAAASARTRADGGWGPVRLRAPGGALHAVGDDRELLSVSYGRGPGVPPPELISTGNGGDPFSESGYTGWFDLDNGVTVDSRDVQVSPCGQVGVLSLRVGGRLTEPPAQRCSTETDVATVPTAANGAATQTLLSSEDNRAPSPLAPRGALVKLTISAGEPGSLSAQTAIPFALSGGFPACYAYLRIGAVRCTGLVPGNRYRLGGRRSRADGSGAVFISGLRLHGGQVLTLRGGTGRALTSLHVAHLRVDITANQTRLAGGVCQAGDYYGPALGPPSSGRMVGFGPGGAGTICPPSGRARGLSTATIAQSDDFSGGQTVISVPRIVSTAPIQDETLYGGFFASAQSGLPGPHGSSAAAGTPIGLRITPAGSSRVVFSAANVDTARGADVSRLPVGTYIAHWRLRDANGDTRTLTTRFVEAG